MCQKYYNKMPHWITFSSQFQFLQTEPNIFKAWFKSSQNNNDMMSCIFPNCWTSSSANIGTFFKTLHTCILCKQTLSLWWSTCLAEWQVLYAEIQLYFTNSRFCTLQLNSISQIAGLISYYSTTVQLFMQYPESRIFCIHCITSDFLFGAT